MSWGSGLMRRCLVEERATCRDVHVEVGLSSGVRGRERLLLALCRAWCRPGAVRNFVRWAMMMKRRESSHGYRERTFEPGSGWTWSIRGFGKDGLLDALKKAPSERILNAELDDHLDVERLEGGPANRRNGSSKKTALTGTSKMTLTIPRDPAGTFNPNLIARYPRPFPELT